MSVRIATFASIALAVPACTQVPSMPAAGSYSDVLVFASAEVGSSGLRVFVAALRQPVVYVVQPEPSFDAVLVPESQFDGQRYRKNLVLAARLDGPGPIAASVRRLLGATETALVRREAAHCFSFEDVFARGQRIEVFTATSAAAVDSLLARAGADCRERLEASAVRRQGTELLRDDDGSARAKQLQAEFGFEIRAPSSYALASPNSAWRDAVEFVRAAPSRLLTVFWLDGVDSTQASNSDFTIGLQRDVLWRLHGDTLLDADTRVVPAELGPYTGLLLSGVWQNQQDVAGGPLRTQFVYDAGRRRLYGVQGLLFAPGRDKRPFVRELQALAATFRMRGTT